MAIKRRGADVRGVEGRANQRGFAGVERVINNCCYHRTVPKVCVKVKIRGDDSAYWRRKYLHTLEKDAARRDVSWRRWL